MRIYCGVSFHGFGHLAQAAPIINELNDRGSIDALTIQCSAPTQQLQQWFRLTFHHETKATDLGIPMVNALKVDAESTYNQYLHQHQQRPKQIACLEQLLQKHHPDLVLTNNSPLLSRAAANLGIPCFHFCSLNWADIFLGYCRGQPEADEIYASLCSDFNTANGFFRLPPYMPMPELSNLIDIGPVCRVGQKKDLAVEFNRPDCERFVLISMGGMPYQFDFSDWPRSKNTVFIFGGVFDNPLPGDFLHGNELSISHIDLVASCDAVITKPGYGTFVEAACYGTPLLYLRRHDWPEEPWLIQWQQDKTYCQEITAKQLQKGGLMEEIAFACEQRRAPIIEPTGAEEIVNHLLAALDL